MQVLILIKLLTYNKFYELKYVLHCKMRFVWAPIFVNAVRCTCVHVYNVHIETFYPPF